MADGWVLVSCMDHIDGVFAEYRVGSRDKIVFGPLGFMRVSCNSPLREHSDHAERCFLQACFILSAEI